MAVKEINLSPPCPLFYRVATRHVCSLCRYCRANSEMESIDVIPMVITFLIASSRLFLHST